MTPSNILVTGGAGFIGANFIHYVLRHVANVRIINLDCLTYAGSLNHLRSLVHPERYHFIEGNICDAALVEKIFNEYQIDAIVHFAAESHVDRSIAGPAVFMQTNIIGTFTLLEVAKHYWLTQRKLTAAQCRFHHVSTDEVYGSLQQHDPAFTEHTAYDPRSPYSASKASSDHLVRAYYHTYGLPITISNCSNNYGPYQHAEKLIPMIIRNCCLHQAIPLYGDGSNIRDWLYVEDHCRALWQVIQSDNVGATYNIGGENEWSNIDIAQLICQHFDKLYPTKKSHTQLIEFVADRPGHDWRYAIDISKIKQDLGWIPQESFASGIAKTIAFYREQNKGEYTQSV